MRRYFSSTRRFGAAVISIGFVVGSCSAPTPRVEAEEPVGSSAVSTERLRPVSEVTDESSPPDLVQLGSAATAGEWVLELMSGSGPDIATSPEWRPTLRIEAEQLWSGTSGCGQFEFLEVNGQIGEVFYGVGCGNLEAQSSRLMEIIGSANRIGLDGIRLIVDSRIGSLTYVPRSYVPFGASEFANALVLPPGSYGTDPSGSGLLFGLRDPDASCRIIWESLWPGPAVVDGVALFSGMPLPAMAFHERVVVLDTPELAAERAAEAIELLNTCRTAEPQDRDLDFNIELDGPATVVAVAGRVRSHNYDPQHQFSETPMDRTTLITVLVIEEAVIVLTAVQAGSDAVHDSFLRFVNDSASRVQAALESQRAAELRYGQL